MAKTNALLLGFVMLALASASSHSCPAGTSVFELVKERHYDLTGTTHVITGGDAGIGLGITQGLAAAGAHVVLLAHNVEKTTKLVASFSGDFSVVPVDLESMASTKKAANSVLEQVDRIDSLILDAGDAESWEHFPEKGSFITGDGFNADVQVSYISAVVLTEMLLPKIRVAQGRVIGTSSANFAGTMDAICTAPPPLPSLKAALGQYGPKCWTPAGLGAVVHGLDAWPNGNVGMIYFLKDIYMNYLARKEAENGVFAFTFHPGAVDSPGMREFYPHVGSSSAAFGVLCRDPNAMGAIWQACLCAGPDGSKSKECPLAPTDSPSGFYLAAAPKKDLVDVNGQPQLMLCGETMMSALNSLDILEAAVGGKKAALDYISTVVELTDSWIAEVDTAEKFSNAKGPELAIFWMILAVMFFTGLLLALAQSRRSKVSEQSDYAILS